MCQMYPIFQKCKLCIVHKVPKVPNVPDMPKVPNVPKVHKRGKSDKKSEENFFLKVELSLRKQPLQLNALLFQILWA